MHPLWRLRIAAGLLLLLAPAGGPVFAGEQALPDLFPVQSSLEDPDLSNELGRDILRFDTLIGNAGSGDLELRGRRSRKMMRAWQVLHSASGKKQGQVKREIGRFEFHDEHGHWHLAQVAEYRLRRLDGELVARSEKISFCMVDSVRLKREFPDSPLFPKYAICPRGADLKKLRAGVQPGWADWYHRDLPDQYLDVTGLPAGQYLLEVEINPDRVIVESDYSNNITSIEVSLPGSEQ